MMKNGIFFENERTLHNYIQSNITNSGKQDYLNIKRAESLIHNLEKRYLELNLVNFIFFNFVSLCIMLYFISGSLFFLVILMFIGSKVRDNLVCKITTLGSESMLKIIFDLISIRSDKVYDDDLKKRNLSVLNDKIKFLDMTKKAEFRLDLSFLGVFLTWFFCSCINALVTGVDISFVLNMVISSFVSCANIKNMCKKNNLISQKMVSYMVERNSLVMSSSTSNQKTSAKNNNQGPERKIKYAYKFNPSDNARQKVVALKKMDVNCRLRRLCGVKKNIKGFYRPGN